MLHSQEAKLDCFFAIVILNGYYSWGQRLAAHIDWRMSRFGKRKCWLLQPAVVREAT